MTNLFDQLPAASANEDFEELLNRNGTWIVRIVSAGQSTPEDAPYDGDHDEWVLLLKGAAGLWVDGESEREIRPGDCVPIPGHRRHRVTWTAQGEATIWLAIHIHAPAEGL